MKNIIKTLGAVLLLLPIITSAQFTVPQGGTGKTSFPANEVLVGDTNLRIKSVATSSLGLPTFSDLSNYLSLSAWFATTTHSNISSLPSLSITESQISDLDHYTSTDFDTDFATKDTGDLAEGSNLYYTAARVQGELLNGNPAIFSNATITNATTTNLAVTGSFDFLGTIITNVSTWFNGLADTWLSGKTTTNLAEGTNLYYTDARVDTRLSATTSLPNLTTLSGVTSIGTSTATTTFEGSLLVKGDLGVIGKLLDVTVASTTVLGDVNAIGTVRGAAGIFNALTIPTITNSFLATNGSGQIVATTTPVMTETDPVYTAASSTILRFGTTSDTLTEGSTNLFWTNTRFDTRLSATTTLPNLTTLLGLTSFGTTSATTTANGNLDIKGTAKVGTLNGLVKAVSGILTTATAGTDYFNNANQIAHDSLSGVHQNVNTTASPSFAGLVVADTSTDNKEYSVQMSSSGSVSPASGNTYSLLDLTTNVEDSCFGCYYASALKVGGNFSNTAQSQGLRVYGVTGYGVSTLSGIEIDGIATSDGYAYGLKIGTITGDYDAYGIYQSGNQPNYFTGPITSAGSVIATRHLLDAGIYRGLWPASGQTNIGFDVDDYISIRNNITYFSAGGWAMALDTASLSPYGNNGRSLGTASNRWNNVYGTNGYFGTQLGVNTTAPGSTLHVVGQSRISGTNARLTLNPGTATTNLWNIDNFGGNFRIFREDYAASGLGANGATRLNITDAGNIGTGGTASNYLLGLGSGTGDKLAVYDNGANTIYGFGVASGRMYAKANNVEVMNWLTTGRVGIGTSTPTQLLTLAGSGAVLGVDNASIFQARNSSGVYDTFLWPRWSDNVMYMNYGASGFNIRNNGSGNTMFMTSDNKVGIKKTNPATELDVSGTIRATGYQSSDGSNGLTGTINYYDDQIHCSAAMVVKNGLIVSAGCI